MQEAVTLERYANDASTTAEPLRVVGIAFYAMHVTVYAKHILLRLRKCWTGTRFKYFHIQILIPCCGSSHGLRFASRLGFERTCRASGQYTVHGMVCIAVGLYMVRVKAVASEP